MALFDHGRPVALLDLGEGEGRVEAWKGSECVRWKTGRRGSPIYIWIEIELELEIELEIHIEIDTDIDIDIHVCVCVWPARGQSRSLERERMITLKTGRDCVRTV